MKNVGILAGSLVCGLAVAASGQEAASATTPAPHVAVIDMNEVLANSVLGKSYQKTVKERRDQLQAQAEKLRAEVEKLDNGLNALQQEMQTQRAVLSDEAFEQKELEARRKQRERDQMAQDSQEQYQLAENEANRVIEKLNAEFTDKITPSIEAVVRARGINLLFHRGTVAFSDPTFDISREVVAKADEAEKLKPTTPGASVAPASAPAKKPAPAKR
jgi:outer membrane protein